MSSYLKYGDTINIFIMRSKHYILAYLNYHYVTIHILQCVYYLYYLNDVFNFPSHYFSSVLYHINCFL